MSRNRDFERYSVRSARAQAIFSEGEFRLAVPLQPLRIPLGWLIGWNKLVELDPTEASVAAGLFGGSSLFGATNEKRRLTVDVEWVPEDDPAGEYHLRVERASWERTERGRRRKDVPLHFGNAQIVHEFRTRSRVELVQELEGVLLNSDQWREHN